MRNRDADPGRNLGTVNINEIWVQIQIIDFICFAIQILPIRSLWDL